MLAPVVIVAAKACSCICMKSKEEALKARTTHKLCILLGQTQLSPMLGFEMKSELLGHFQNYGRLDSNCGVMGFLKEKQQIQVQLLSNGT